MAQVDMKTHILSVMIPIIPIIAFSWSDYRRARTF